jgi:hypothetical protein
MRIIYIMLNNVFDGCRVSALLGHATKVLTFFLLTPLRYN